MEKKYDVVALGEFLIDFTPAGSTDSGMKLFEQNPGGAPVNMLTAVSKAGLKTAFIGKVGDDMHGNFLIETAKQAGIDTRGIVVDDTVFTTLAFVTLDENGEREFSFARKPGADTMLCYKEVDAELLRDTKVFHTIHGRAAAVATGAKVANPNLTIWQISGDGDGLAIGGNHFIHAVRRNIDLNMILLNNRIYGLTKGQYSPTSERGFVSKSSPYGTVEDPFHPAELAFGARGRFFARCIAVDGAASVEVLKAAANHKGASVVEVLQNCVIFNDGTHASVATKEGRAKNAIYLEHGKPMLFGENKEFGLMQEGFGLKVVKLGENGVTEKDILIHDAHCQDNTLQLKLALMEGPDFPIALGVIRDVDAPTYNDAVAEQIEEIKGKKKYHNFQELLMTNDTWEVK